MNARKKQCDLSELIFEHITIACLVGCILTIAFTYRAHRKLFGNRDDRNGGHKIFVSKK